MVAIAITSLDFQARLSKRRRRILDAIQDGLFDYAKEFPDSKRALLFAKQPGDVLTVKSYLTDWLESHRLKIKASCCRARACATAARTKRGTPTPP
ncbi:uncharacterized protein DUF3596 [Trinickia symbiotica]|uniref:Arm DNA-binding domain-containing protein n=1 Tax=Trinickia symbiotica TaxID=863227 RepID=UPI000377F992|nr:DUF3596 domain-containing protein [Trinickia symbiotica]PPK41144.1 uncharacterized protein DUF3596 [Trinickia symbiotica]